MPIDREAHASLDRLIERHQRRNRALLDDLVKTEMPPAVAFHLRRWKLEHPVSYDQFADWLIAHLR
jgi:hypothetical protein